MAESNMNAGHQGQYREEMPTVTVEEVQLESTDLGTQGTEEFGEVDKVDSGQNEIPGLGGEGAMTTETRDMEENRGGKKKSAGEGEKVAGEQVEGDKTKDGTVAGVGEKRERQSREDAAGELGNAEEESGKEAKKAKVAKKGRGKKTAPKTASKTQGPAAATDGKKRSVGRPRKNTVAVSKEHEVGGKEVVQKSGEGNGGETDVPAHHTRSQMEADALTHHTRSQN